MMLAVREHYVLGPELATASLVALVVAAAGAWAGLRALTARIRSRRVGRRWRCRPGAWRWCCWWLSC